MSKCRQDNTQHLKEYSTYLPVAGKERNQEAAYQANDDRSDQKPVIALLPSWILFPHNVLRCLTGNNAQNDCISSIIKIVSIGG